MYFALQDDVLVFLPKMFSCIEKKKKNGAQLITKWQLFLFVKEHVQLKGQTNDKGILQKTNQETTWLEFQTEHLLKKTT